MAADRGAFIDQSQSLNIHIARPSYANITSMHFYGWKKVCILSFTPLIKNIQGLKTGMYYLRTKPAVNAVQFTVDKTALKNREPATSDIARKLVNLTTQEEDEGCLMCSG